MIKKYFANYFMHNLDVTFDLASNGMTVHQKRSEPWKITLVDTGEMSGTGGFFVLSPRVIDYDRVR